MAKAEIVSKDGTKITIDGTPEEIAKIIDDVKKKDERKKLKESFGVGGPTTATDFILELREQGFFNKPKTLAEIKTKLAENGLIYPVTSLSAVVLAQVRKRNLGRVKTGKFWGYVRRGDH